jgi:LEA14-like dessication related protein
MRLQNKMKIFIQILVVVVLFTSCTFDEPIVFKKVRNVKLTSIQNGKLKLDADAEFYNPNSISGKLKQVDVEISMGSKKLAQIDLKEKLKIDNNETFLVPLNAEFAMEDIQQGLLDNLVSILGGKKIKLHFKGEIKVSRWGISQSVPVDYFQEVKL